MSFYSDASLVMIPSGYKTSKVYSAVPTDGSGDLSFTRTADTATRVASNGLIERVRTNLVRSSNNISIASTYWRANQSGTTTQNAAVAPDGTTTAALITPNGIDAYSGVATASTITLAAAPYTFSAYLKTNSGTASVTLLVLDSATTFHQVNVTATTTWTRFSVSFTAAAGAAEPFITSSGSTAWLAWGAQLETSDIATNLIPTTTAAVSVGPVANVPRLDYLGSSCPRLLLEPQRTNLVTYSEQQDNAAWNKAGATITANATTSPDGYTNADKVVETTSTGTHGTYASAIISNATAYTWSGFFKAGERTKIQLLAQTGGTPYANFNLSNGTVDFADASLIASVQAYGNGWYRCIVTGTSSATTAYFNWSMLDASGNASYTGNGTSGLFAWGCSIEAGAYATSYIPTLGASVTRGADAASKTGISSLIGQTEGTLFGEFTFTGISSTMHLFSSAAGSFGNAVYVQTFSATGISMQVWSGVVNQVSINSSGLTVGQNVKFAAAYKNNDFALYVNGVQAGTDTSGTVPSGLSQLEVGGYAEAGSPFNFNSSIKQALLFKTRLSNADLAALTA